MAARFAAPACQLPGPIMQDVPGQYRILLYSYIIIEELYSVLPNVIHVLEMKYPPI